MYFDVGFFGLVSHPHRVAQFKAADVRPPSDSLVYLYNANIANLVQMSKSPQHFFLF